MDTLLQIDWDMGDPRCAGLLLASILIGMVIAVRMDMRKLPLGEVKFVPWTTMTIILLFAAFFTAKILLLDVMAA